MTPKEFDAYCLKAAVKGLGTDEKVNIPIVVQRVWSIYFYLPMHTNCRKEQHNAANPKRHWKNRGAFHFTTEESI